MTNNVEVNERAGALANGVTQLLAEDGIPNTLVWITSGYAFDMPLAVRTADNQGFGHDRISYYNTAKVLASEAILQARYSVLGDGRSADEQITRERENKRHSSSYSVRFGLETTPGYVIDKRSGLSVVTRAAYVPTAELVKITKRAIVLVNSGVKPRMLDAGKWLHACFLALEAKLPEDMSGLAMITLSRYYSLINHDIPPGPVVVGAQAAGSIVDPKKFDILQAKAYAVANTKLPSGKQNDKTQFSNIRGAVPANIKEYGNRILVVGGLDMNDDVQLLEEVATSTIGQELGVTILNEFARD